MNKEEILNWLKETDTTKLQSLWKQADSVRKDNVGDAVHLRGLIEASNICSRQCRYCGINADQGSSIPRYRMTFDEMTDCAQQAMDYGYGSVVVQAGEDPGLTTQLIEDFIKWVKDNTSLAITLSLGERDEKEFICWHKAGADRYLLRFETSDQKLYENIHPPLKGQKHTNRFEILRQLKAIGYETGSGVMVGIPGQGYDILANDIISFKELGLHMIGIGPFIPHPDTPLGRGENLIVVEDQVPNTQEMTCKALALTRILCPETNLPSTTALSTLSDQGREQGLNCGGNVIMPNLTPIKYRKLYEIYPAKSCIKEDAQEFHNQIKIRIESIGRTVGKGRGDSVKFSSSH